MGWFDGEWDAQTGSKNIATETIATSQDEVFFFAPLRLCVKFSERAKYGKLGVWSVWK
jgi:hypothetical protein